MAVFLGVPAGDGFPDTKELLGLAEALHELARELVPSATTHTEVTLTRPPTRDQNAGGIAIDLAQREVVADAATVDLTRLEFSLLAHLALPDRRVVGRDELMVSVWRGHRGGPGRRRSAPPTDRSRPRHPTHGGQAFHEPHAGIGTSTNPASKPQADYHETYRRFR